MKKIFLLRHALALPAAAQGDKERKLAPQGELDARALGRAMAQKKYQPSYILCSPATRTRQTLSCVLENVGEAQSDFPEVLYDGGCGDLVHELQTVNESYGSVLLVGHNPSIQELAATLTGSGAQTLLMRLSTEGYRPCTLSVLSFGAAWAELQPGACELADYMEPMDFNAPATPARWT